MKQISLVTSGFELVTERTRKPVFLDEISLVVSWRELVALIQPFAPTGTDAKGGRPTFAVETMLRIHFLQQWFSVCRTRLWKMPSTTRRCTANSPDSMPAWSECLTRLPSGAYRHLLEEHNLSIQLLVTINATLIAKCLMLKTATVVDATLIAAPSSTKNSTGERDPQMHQTKKGNQWCFGMKAHIGVDAESGLIHTVIGTAGNVNDVTQGHGLLHDEESVVFADAGYQGAAKREEATGVPWQAAMRPGKHRALDKHSPWGSLLDKSEQLKARIRAKVEHPFRLIKRQFGFTKVRYKTLAKNTAQLITLFALSNVWMARRHLLATRK